MAVTVVGRWHVPDGQHDRAIAAAQHDLDVRASQPPARREAHVFQATDDPSLLLYVAEWSDRAAFELFRVQSGPNTIEAAIGAGGEYIICERLLFYGNFAYGAEAAARTYFSRSARSLTLPQAALLAGLTQAPSSYNPLTNPERAVARRNEVLAAMPALGTAPLAWCPSPMTGGKSARRGAGNREWLVALRRA